MLTLVMSILCLVTTSCLYVSVKKNLEFLEKVELLTESIQTTVDILEEQHQKINQKSKIEVFSDDPIIRELVRDIGVAKTAVLKSAKILDDSIAEEDESETQET
jgi:hypothetical protein